MTWDRTRPWILQRREVGWGRVHLHFDPPDLSIKQLAAIRRVVPGLASATPREIRARLSPSGDFEVGEFGYIEARWIEDAARKAGLPVIFTNMTYVEYVILDESGSNVVIADDEEHARVVREMIEAGVRVVDLAID